ncbi:hypothetical protein [Wukongibacter sp. M2B1]|uniref:hypothetical protein n=1 Tax=Wukongibacter sp. M2B1 TaxID=3088895 RepID=UPI003D7BE58E
MKNVMAWIIGITLTLGMIAFGVLTQVSGARDIGEKGSIEQTKVSMMITDNNTVTGNTVKNYIKQEGLDVTVDSDDDPDADEIADGALYKMTKSYNEDGVLDEVKFKIIDLSRGDDDDDDKDDKK